MPGKTSRRPGSLAAAVLAAAVTLSACDGDAGRRGAPPLAGDDARSEVRHAPWKVHTQRIGGGRIGKKGRKRFRAVRSSALRVVRRTYGAVFGDDRSLRAVGRTHFARPARRALLRSRPGVPYRGVLQATRRRKVSVGIRGPGWSQAAARTTILARIRLRGRRVRILHRGVMWLERGRSGWRVIAFEFDQRALR